MKKGITTALYCQSCGSRLLWHPDNRAEVKLEADGTVHGLTLSAACVNCQSTYSAWLPILQAPAWWEETRADTSRSTHTHESLKNHQRATTQKWVAAWYRCPTCGREEAYPMPIPGKYKRMQTPECYGLKCERTPLEIVERRWYTTFAIESGLDGTTVAETLASMGPFRVCDITMRNITQFRIKRSYPLWEYRPRSHEPRPFAWLGKRAVTYLPASTEEREER